VNRQPGRLKGAVVLELVKGTRPIPPMPRAFSGTWTAAAKSLWEAFWTAPIAQNPQVVNRQSDMPRLSRWILYCDEWFRLMRQYRRERVVRGSVGQPVMNPAFAAALAAEKEIAKIEERFGLTPLDRMRLGITFSEARSALDKLNEDLEVDGAEDDFGVPAGYEVREIKGQREKPS